MTLTGNERVTRGLVTDNDGRVIVTGPDGVPIAGGSGGGGSDPLSDGTPGGALPTKTLWIAGADGSVLRGIAVDSSARVRTVVENTVGVTGPLTDTQLRASAVPVSGSFFQATQPVSGPLTDTQLRASAVPVTGPLTDTQLRASAVPVSGTVTASGPLTDTQLRASAVPTSAAQLPSSLGQKTIANSISVTLPSDLAPVSIVGSAPAQTTGSWTSATGLNTAITATGLGPYGAATAVIVVPSTVTGGAISIETSHDGTNWGLAGSVRVDNSQYENVPLLAYAPGIGGTRQYLVSLDGLTQFRLRLSTVITGSGTVSVAIAPAQQAAEPLVAQRSRKVTTYRAVFRATARPYTLGNTFVANTRKQMATIHHAATATKLVRLRRVLFTIMNNTAVAQLSTDLIRITTAPVTGNPAVTASKADSSDAAAEVTMLAMPTTAATEEAQPFSTEYGFIGASGTSNAGNPQPMTNWYDLLAPDGAGPSYDDEAKLPTIRPGVLEGWSITVDANAATTISFMAIIEFTEEAP